MAHTRSKTGLDAALDVLSAFFHQKRDHLRDALERRKVYRTTYQELSMLSNRDLDDLGIPRSHIHRIALESAYGV